MRSASEFHRRSVENLRRRWRFVFQSPAAKRFGAITARSSAGRRGAEEVAALQSQIQALQIELDNPSHALALLRARRERPRGRRAAECSQQFPPSDGDCHTPLPREVRKGNDTTPRACCPNSAAPERAGRTPATAERHHITGCPRRPSSPILQKL